MFTFLPDLQQEVAKFLTQSPFLYTLLSLFFILYLIKWLFFTQTSTKNLPPSVPKLPIIGNLHQLGALPHQSLRSLAQRHGPFMIVHLGTVPNLVVSSAEAAREMMKTHDIIFSDRPERRMWRRLLYDLKEVSVAPYGEYWRQAKSIMVLQMLSNKRVESFRGIREEETTLMMNKIRASAAEAVDLSDLFVTLTNDVVCRVTFGRKYSEAESGKKFKKLLRDFFGVLGGLNVGDFIPRLAWVDRLSGLDSEVDRIAEAIDEFLEGVVEERLLAKQTASESRSEDFVDILLKIQKEDTTAISLDRLAMKALVLDAYTAGTDTTATVLEWVMTELLGHPIVMNKMQAEVREIVHGKQHITEDDLKKMHYLKAVIKETLRLHPPIPLLVPRVSTQDTKVMGFDIPRGTRVIINAWAVQRDPKMWDEPEEFRPERFLNSGIDFKGHDFQLIPFGAGRRSCPGIAFAMATDDNVIANLLHKFDWELPNGETAEDFDMTERNGLVVRKRIPLLAVATPFSY